jgi:hypothetical protein
MLIFNLIVLLAIIFVYYSAIRAWYVWWQIGREGILTTAKVIFLKQGKGLIVRSMSVSYSFEAPAPASGNQETFTATRSVNGAAYMRARNTSQIEIKYLPKNPGTSLIVGDNFERNFITIIAIGLPIVVAFLASLEQTAAR